MGLILSGISSINQAFDHSRPHQLAYLSLRLGGFLLTRDVTEHSEIIISDDRSLYTKIVGRIYKNKLEVDENVKFELMMHLVDPLASAQAYGKSHKRCAICNHHLTKHINVEDSIGLECANSYGWLLTKEKIC